MTAFKVGDKVTHDFSTNLTGEVLEIDPARAPYKYRVKWSDGVEDWFLRSVLRHLKENI